VTIDTQTIRRHAIRGLIYDEKVARVLLIQMVVQDTGKLIWLAPGGGMETDESVEDCLFREVEEETGFRPNACLGPIWHRRHQFLLNGKQWDQSEEFYLISTQRFEPVSTNNPVEFEARAFRAFKWWTAEEIAAASDEIFVPLRFAEHFRSLVEDGLPHESIDVGV
jgi:8-oxo-dGTP pyrophosphatase MutT (NUDIX family)